MTWCILATTACPALAQAGLLAAESVVVAAFILFLFRLRSDYGLSLLYVVLGGFQYIQALLILSVYVELLPHFIVSPGSAVIFTATLFAVLLVYVREDGIEARKLVYGIALANIGLSLLTIMVARHMQLGLADSPIDLPAELFLHTPRIMVTSTLILILDVTFILAVYRALGRFLRRWQLTRTFLSMLAALIVDSYLFTFAAFVGHESFRGILYSGLMSKAVVAVFYSMFLTAYTRIIDSDRLNSPLWQVRMVELLSSLRYRSKYEALKREYVRDHLTRVFSRGFFEDAIIREVARSERSDQPVSIVMMDLDRFKAVNDRYGHQEGDRVLRAIGAVLSSELRPIDVPCRYGGEEFCIILPSSGKQDAVAQATRLKEALRARCSSRHPDPLVAEITATMGVASYPEDARTPGELVGVADRRLYEGKRSGRNVIVSQSAAGRVGELIPAAASPEPAGNG